MPSIRPRIINRPNSRLVKGVLRAGYMYGQSKAWYPVCTRVPHSIYAPYDTKCTLGTSHVDCTTPAKEEMGSLINRAAPDLAHGSHR